MPKLGNIDPSKLEHPGTGTGKVYWWATDGLGLAVTPAGGKSWYRKYSRAGKVVWVKLGDWPSVTRKMAESRNAEISLKLLQGIDPQLEKRQNQEATIKALNESTFKEACEFYLNLRKDEIAASYFNQVRSWLNRLCKVIGQTYVKDIEVVILKKAFNDAGMDASVSRKGFWIVKEVVRKSVINRKASIDNVYNLEAKDILGRAPLQKHQPSFAHTSNLEGFSTFLKDLEIEVTKGGCIASITKAITYLPIRKVEMMILKWSYVDFETKTITIPPINNKRRYDIKQPMSDQIIALFKLQLKRYPKSEYVFPGRDDYKHSRASNPSTTKFIDALGYRDKQSIHGLRSCFKTFGKTQLFLQFEVTAMTLGHEIKNKETGRPYDFTNFWEERSIGLQKWADFVDSLKERTFAPK